jgi:hypothetical protein
VCASFLPKNVKAQVVVWDFVSCKWHIMPITENIFCSELFQGKNRELITRQAKPNNILDVETTIISLR